jgi:diguanylate cyclase
MDSLRQELESIRDESRTDQLTGIANRRQFDERLHQLSASSTKNNEPLSLVLGDIDFFKKFNDEFGHQAGDQVLRIVGEQLRQNVKGKDW